MAANGVWNRLANLGPLRLVRSEDPLQAARRHHGSSPRQSSHETQKVLKHEGFHQYIDEYLDGVPAWYNEGLAEYFSATQKVMVGKKRAMKVRPEKQNLQIMVAIFQGRTRFQYTPVAELMNMSQYEMYDVANGHQKQGLHYAQSWSIVYFCAEGGNGKYRAALKKYFKVLRKGKSIKEAYKATFGKFNMKRFEEEWKNFILKLANTDAGI